ncbi:hypothetical protein XH79_38015 [Bradyrhizobium sp. CCBAU 45389]|nr:hypothetical protein [Bradyrhizobium sp. CCBAU 45389]
MAWAAHTHYWTLSTGASVWLTTSVKLERFPPVGTDLPIVLGDATIINTIVLASSPSAVVIELDSGHLRRLTLASHPSLAVQVSEWIVQRRV